MRLINSATKPDLFDLRLARVGAARSWATLLSAALALAVPAEPRQANAAGFAIHELSAPALGMGNAVTGIADSPAAIAFNPAGLVTQQGLSFEASLSLIAPYFGYDTTLPSTGEPIRAEADHLVHFIPSFFASYRLHDRLAVGLGVYSPFGLQVSWSDRVDDGVAWWGRSVSKNLELKTVTINPTIAVKLHDRVMLGAGFVVAQAAVTFERAVTTTQSVEDDVDVKLSGDDVGFGATAGLLVKAIPGRLHIGVGYRSAIELTLEGNAAFTKNGSSEAVPAALRTQLVDGPVEAPLTLPHTVYFGLGVFPTERLKLGLNVDVITWSTYERLQIDFLRNPQLSSSELKDWNTAFAVRLGAEYEVLDGNLPVRLGLIFDRTPIPDATLGPELPDVDRILFAFGLGYTWMGIRADVGYQFLYGLSDETASSAPVVGTHDGLAHVATLSLGYSLDL